MRLIFIFCLALLATAITNAQPYKLFNDSIPKLANLNWRSVGPAFASGRIGDLAIDTSNPGTYYVAVSSGGIWKTTNWGTTYEPIFDQYGSYSIGCLALDPNNPQTIYAGTGEANNQRSVAYGDGVYRSEDGGASWKNIGLKASEHISRVWVDPRDSRVLVVAAYGPLWKEGGDRGIYRSEDGGATWTRTLFTNEFAGAADLIVHPENPDIMFASMHQRMRKVYTYVASGEGSGVFRSADGGKTWSPIREGLPTTDLGRVGLAIGQQAPYPVYAIVEAADGEGGVYSSSSLGAKWEKQNKYRTSGNYYQEIVVDPNDNNRIYFLDTYLHVSTDGGKTVSPAGEKHKHVDNHALWINPRNSRHMLAGCDGGIYETYDLGTTWQFKPNLPVTQFYKVAVDNAEPFYNIYGGTQDNASMGGPSQTTHQWGISNSDWFVTQMGDGFESAIDPTNPDIVYAQYQYGGLVRYDKRTGEKTGIQPMPGKGEPAYRWNWDAPLLISPHDEKTLYFCANKVFRSTDRGNSWEVISSDLSRQLDRNSLKIMGKVQPPEAVEKNMSTSIFGNITAFDESPLKQGLLYAGTDDGLIHVSEDGGANWRKIESVSGVPAMTYVNQLVASKHHENGVYAIFNNHKNGDFKPYIYYSANAGKSWQPVTGNLPERGTTYCFAQDHANEHLLFAGTEFGVFFSVNGGSAWNKLGSGLPVIAVKDMAIQPRENDLVLATFGRGFYVLDDYSALRNLASTASGEAHLYQPADAWLYVPQTQYGLRGKAFQGESFYTAPNPTYGAAFDIYLNEGYETLKDRRLKKQKADDKAGRDINYPSLEVLRAEQLESKPQLLLEIKQGKEVIRRIYTEPKAGMQRIYWDLKLPITEPVELGERSEGSIFSEPASGQYVAPGIYSAQLLRVTDTTVTALTEPRNFTVKPIGNQVLPDQNAEQTRDFYADVADLRRSVSGNEKVYADLKERHSFIKRATLTYMANNVQEALKQLNTVEDNLNLAQKKLYGDNLAARLQMETYPGITDRLSTIIYTNWYTLSEPTGSNRQNYEIALDENTELTTLLQQQLQIIEQLEQKLNQEKIPFTPGRERNWKKP